MNRVCLVGRLTAKPELRYTPSNVPTTRFSVAVNRTRKNEQGVREADFISIVAWRATAELICNYFDKGNQIGLEGRIQTGSYDDKDGNKRYTTDVVVDQVYFIDSRNSGNSTSSTPDVSPYDYQNDTSSSVNVENDPFADFGDSVSIDDSFLD